MAAAALPDLDGLGILAGEELYWDLHHKLGHNIFFFAFVAGTSAILARHRVTVFMACFALGWLHFVLDYFGSGPGWDLYPWWPLGDHAVRWDNAWPFFSWQNLSSFGLLLAASLLIVLKLGRTPLEWLMPRLDSQLASLLRRPFVGRDVPAHLE